MARTVANVWVGADGRAYVAATSATAPTGADSSLDGSWTELGWINEDGLTEASNEDFTEVKGWDGTVIRKIRTSAERTFAFTCMETNKAVLELFYPGSSVTAASGGSKIEVESSAPDRRAFVFDVIDGDAVARYYVGNGEVSERGDVTHAAGEAVAYTFTVTAYPDTDGVSVVKFFTADYTS